MYFNVRADAAFFNLNVEGFWSVQNSLLYCLIPQTGIYHIILIYYIAIINTVL